MKNIFLILFLVIFNTGCVATYQGESSSIKLDNNVFKVSFEGKKNMSLKEAEDKALLQAANITLENGFSYFEILDDKLNFNQKTYKNRTPVVINNGFLNPYGFYHYNHFNSVIIQDENEIISMPYVSYIIKLHKNKQNNNLLYNAEIINNQLKESVN